MSQQPLSNPSTSSPVIAKILEQSKRVLETYRVDPGLIQEHANGERRITQGGYGDRQLFEIVQNAADEIANAPGGTVHVVLTDTHLYCANEGTPVTPEGTETILRMGVSRKRGGQIGRFGVGVKSYLVVTDAPQFFSTTGSFGFDRAWSRAEIARAASFAADSDFESPVLRMARRLDESAERRADSVLDELRSWATTVVRLPLFPGAANRLANDIHNPGSKNGQEEFPKLFQLFSSHVGEVVLEDRRRMPIVRRVITVDQDGACRTINEKGTGRTASSVKWKVFTVAHQPTGAARGTAGELHDRATIDLSWAVPEYAGSVPYANPASGRGRFWSFFPTKYEMTLSGALNGAWKTNEDRQNLLDSSPFNQELLQVAAKLVVTSLPQLAPAEDPAAYLSFLPGRTKVSEMLSWADELLTRSIWKLTAVLPSLPDQDGRLRLPRDLHIHPDEGRRSGKVLKPEWLRMWSSYSGRPSDWLHPSVEAAEIRSGKVEHILEAAGHKRAGVVEWLEALVDDGKPEASAVAVRIVAAMVNEGHPFAEEARRAKVVLTESGRMVAPVAGQVWRRSVQDGLKDDLRYVHPKLDVDPSLQLALSALGIREADSRGRFVGVLDQGFANYSTRDWQHFWELFRSAGGTHVVDEVRARFPKPAETLHVLTLDGTFHPMRNCMMPGPVVPDDGSRDRSVTVDLRFHTDDTAVFHEFGLRDRLWRSTRTVEDPWFEQYREALYEAYCRTLGSKSRPSISRMVTEGSAVPDGLHLLLMLSDEGRAAFIRALPDHLVVDQWTRQIGASASTRSAVPSPIRWLLRKYGMVPTSQGPRRLVEAVGPQLSEYAEVLPVAQISAEKARKLGLPTTVEDVPEGLWEKLTNQLLTSEDDAFVGNTYVLMTRQQLPFPDGFTRCRVGDSWETREDGEIAVTASPTEYEVLRVEGLPALLTESAEDAELLIDKWGMLAFTDVISKETRHVPSGEPVPLRDAYPTLRQRLGSVINNYQLQYCSELAQVTTTQNGMKPKPLKRALTGTTVLVLEPVSRLEALVAAVRELRWNLSEADCRAVLDAQRQQEQDQKIQQSLQAVREANTVVEKLALLLDAKTLRERLPENLLKSELRQTGGAEPSAERIAQMAYNSHGEGVLQIHARDLQVRFPNHAPSSFSGSAQAVKFVSDLGFPDVFAGSRAPRLEPRIEVEGPSEFPRLHGYQERLATNIFQMLDRVSPQRGMLSLPTGAGKTRVTAEAVIRWIKQDGDLEGPVLWIAQTEELCEQAVQSWKFVWSKVGAEKPLTISRLWSSNEAGPVSEGPHLVIATDAKLRNCLATDSYTWLRQPALVIVDEAHVAIAPQYTEILAQLGLTHSRTERHLLGLTATPFRNTNEEETKRLIQRFGARRLDEGVFQGDPYAELQELGMLARVEHQELLGGTIVLDEYEKARADQLSVLAATAEQRLAADDDRNQRIIDEILAMPTDWPVLVFATSVSHAKFLAAKLNDRGIRAAAVDSATSDRERRNRIDAFRQRRLRVLTNYGVLTQGFDAPATRAVVVARPTYSPNIYQQMIGRGLRGPRNGGKPMCLILNVRDNITNYGKALAFTQFEHLWSAK
ncbi:DEAD/DEAH box helicase family protein [Streptomyces sp. NPDC056291]|uniref:DEAD/DEAH box helicase family protein n=1 Tax=Streptomyces sp. NPDC056291 TaxID=3345772 RepID=UPI0035DC4341